MQHYETDKLVHVMAALSATKESAVHHREHREPGQTSAKWPDEERKNTQGWLRSVLPVLEGLDLGTIRHFFEKLAGEIEHLPILSIITQADYVRELLEQELKKRQFFVLDVNGGYYDNPLLAGAPFRDNWPTANKELVEAGNCFAVDRYTACVCHLMRALEYALKAFENELKITAPARGPENTWGKIIGRIEQKKKQPSPEWMAKAGFNDNCLTFFCAVKSACRDKTFHVESSYDKGSASSLFSCTVAVLSEISKELKEI